MEREFFGGLSSLANEMFTYLVSHGTTPLSSSSLLDAATRVKLRTVLASDPDRSFPGHSVLEVLAKGNLDCEATRLNVRSKSTRLVELQDEELPELVTGRVGRVRRG